jgi:hypothetical protein
MAKKQKVVKEKKDIIEDYYFFQTPIYKIKKTNFLDSTRIVSLESVTEVNKDKEINDIYAFRMSGDLSQDPRLQEFSNYVLGTAWNILDSQGYAMDYFDVGLSAMWLQEHHKYSGMDQHVHGEGTQLTVFYFIDVPENSSKVIFHDPRTSKLQIDLPQRDNNAINLSSKMVVISPEPGDLIFSNAYVPHSFTKNGSDKPLNFIHMNIFTAPHIQTKQAPEII